MCNCDIDILDPACVDPEHINPPSANAHLQVLAVRRVIREQEARMEILFARRGSRPYPAMIYTTALEATLDHPESDCSDCGHDSGCATHNAPALPPGPCDCKKSAA